MIGSVSERQDPGALVRAAFKAGRKEAPVYGARKRGSAAKMSNGVPGGHEARTNFGPLAVIAATKSVRGAVPWQVQMLVRRPVIMVTTLDHLRPSEPQSFGTVKSLCTGLLVQPILELRLVV